MKVEQALAIHKEADFEIVVNVFRQELDRMKIKLKTPDINRSGVTFDVETETDPEAPYKHCIRYALAAVKNVGGAAMESLVADRTENGEFDSITDFTDRLDARQVNKRQLENLARAGAFDPLTTNRRQVFDGIETILRHAAVAAEERNSNQISLFGGDDQPQPQIELPATPDWPVMERLREEFGAIGFYLSAHPLDAYGGSLKRLDVEPVAEIIARGLAGPVNTAGTVIAMKVRTSQKGSKYAFVQMSDASGVYEVAVFSETLAAARDVLEVGNSVLIKGSVTFDGETEKFIANSIQPLDKVASNITAGLKITIDSEDPIAALAEVLARHNGGGPKARGKVHLLAKLPDGRQVSMKLDGGYAITPEAMAEVRAVPGLSSIEEL